MEIVKCNQCGHVLIEGTGGASCYFGPGTTIGCRKCGNSYTFGKNPTDETAIQEISQKEEK